MQKLGLQAEVGGIEDFGDSLENIEVVDKVVGV
jgi:hypothetical protein